MQSDPLVSIVTPVYNGDKYLEACIDSVLAQTYTNWEFVILDNCSSDASGEIARRYAALDSRIRVERNSTTVPVIANFNRAASFVSKDARYLKFLCADDTLFPECMQRMVDLAEAHPEVQLVASYKIHGRLPVCEGPPFPDEIASGKDVCKWFFEGKLGVLGSPTDHLIRLPTILVDGKIFDEKFLHADIEFWIRLLKDGTAYGFVHQVLMFTRVHEEAVSSQFAHVMGSGLSEMLAMLVKDGHSFLTPTQFKAIENTMRRDYSRFLFRSFLKVWDRRIWNFQKDSWKKFGLEMGMAEILQAGVVETASSVLSPRLAIERLRRDYARGRQ